mmetsp:Transcript_18616/g.46091  ORF Transcript_18616/g.46091 Transcript_18616/m.46091 type:complete len:527 (+) Transcript_18616:128-1708(+)|eukprot:CAMPEP_0113630816 /NCGR_PEP_ID=MMETSP0017_2-20120614/16012_1 /TAXON_ID=2856 /ORGANISM="Cylindrotheca closterium" /LENGTH=526 /DNA_ID=CAMNT_0000541297 /DNA_START=59 /DNA_END=1639 /DNA_ORIENTATION=+ /assembly_acc=CAM_ASM_000147
MTDKNARFEEAVEAMTKSENRFDVTIICTTDDHQADFWMSKLSDGLSKEGEKFPMVIAVSEDWAPGGAGNGLGTLYAWQKAVKLAKTKFDADLEALMLDNTVSAALFHTAGKGTRMAPLPASENNNKPGVKLPFLSTSTGKAMTVLEAVVQQSGIYAPSRKGRLSVFWGDQVFLPSVSFQYTPTHHVDIMCTLLGDTAPTPEEWAAQGLEKYGVIAVLEGDKAETAQVEKVDHATATRMLGQLGTIKQVGPSLGSFSVSGEILKAMLEEYSTELTEKTAKLDTDPHFWMPLTLSEADYIYLMKQKGIDEGESKSHYARMKVFSEKFDKGDMGLFGAVDVGKDACWWDYGQLKLYSKNTTLLLEDSNPECGLLRKFLGLTDGPTFGKIGEADVVHSFCFNSKIASGNIKDTIACQVNTKELNAEGAIVVNCVAPRITAGKGCILYNIMSEEEIIAQDGQVMVAVTAESGDSFVLKSKVDIDGGKAWKIVVEDNENSFEQVWKNNKMANISKIDAERTQKFNALSEKL